MDSVNNGLAYLHFGNLKVFSMAGKEMWDFVLFTLPKIYKIA